MSDITLSSAQRILLQRTAAAGTDGFEIVPRARSSASILVGHGLLELVDEVCRLTAAGRLHLGLPAEPEERGQTRRQPRQGSKAAQVIELLRRDEGATVSQLSEVTGWLPHSVRGFLAGALKKTHGLSAASRPTEGGRLYRIVERAE